MKKGLLLLNIGTPAKPAKKAVAAFLADFLTDKRVIDLPVFFRYLLVYGLILPLRTRQSTHAYQQIWQENGSPLLSISLQLVEEIKKNLDASWEVAFGMRYGNPSIESALNTLKTCRQLVVLPLFPQFASSSTGSALEKTLGLLAQKTIQPALCVITDFYQEPWFIHALAALVKPCLENGDFLLFSYHGIPARHLLANGCQTSCSEDCPPVKARNDVCYRAQCQQTSASLAACLGLPFEKFATTFQSRLGKATWIKPYTEVFLTELAQKGIKKLVICCPSFTTDCLETLEEIGIRARDLWLRLGGEKFTLVPCLNTSETWVKNLSQVAKNSLCAIEST